MHPHVAPAAPAAVVVVLLVVVVVVVLLLSLAVVVVGGCCGCRCAGLRLLGLGLESSAQCFGIRLSREPIVASSPWLVGAVGPQIQTSLLRLHWKSVLQHRSKHRELWVLVCGRVVLEAWSLVPG